MLLRPLPLIATLALTGCSVKASGSEIPDDRQTSSAQSSSPTSAGMSGLPAPYHMPKVVIDRSMFVRATPEEAERLSARRQEFAKRLQSYDRKGPTQ